MKTIAQLLRESKSLNISEDMLKSIEIIEYTNLARAYELGRPYLTFEEWYEQTFEEA